MTPHPSEDSTRSDADLKHRRFRPGMNWIDLRIFVVRELGHGACWALVSMAAYTRWPDASWKAFTLVALGMLFYRMVTAGAGPTIVGLQSLTALISRSMKPKR